MGTMATLKRSIFLVCFLTFLLCFNSLSYAVVLDNGKEDEENKLDRLLPLDPRRAPDVSGKTKKPEYMPGEVIIKLKEKQEAEILFSSSYSERESTQENILSRLKGQYNLKDEEPVFKGLHNQLKAKNLSQRGLEEEINAKSLKIPKAAPKPKEQVDLLPIYILKTDEDVLTTCKKLRQDSSVEYAEPNMEVKLQMLPNDPYYSSKESWGQGYDDLWGIKKLQCERGWDISQGEGVIVAVIDTGVDYNHEDLAQNIWVNPGEDLNNNGVVDTSDFNGIDDDNNGHVDDIRGWDFRYGDNDPMDDYGHGTHVAGTIAGVGNNSKGVIGVAPKALVMNIKGFDSNGSGYEADLANCVIYAADNGARVISNSWSGQGISNVFIDVFHYAHSKGSLAIAAAGNSNVDVSRATPANIDTVIAVAASTQRDEKCDFSNYGAKIDVSAPGGGYVNELGGGRDDRYNILSSMSESTPLAVARPQLKVAPAYYRLAGTSMACPHVSGVAALIIAKNRNLTNEEVRGIICGSSDDIGDIGKDTYFGYGRINAARAVGSSTIYISSPRFNAYLRGVENIQGSASIEGFLRYELYYVSKNDINNPVIIISSTTPVINGVLGTWDTAQCSDGEYYLFLKVIKNDSIENRIFKDIIVDNRNEPPVFRNMTDKISFLGQHLEFKIEVVDPDDPNRPWGQLIYSAKNIPAGARLDPVTQIFSWDRSISDGKSYAVTFIVNDSENSTEKEIRLLPAEFSSISTGFLAFSLPAIYGDRIVWAQLSGGIYVYDLSTRSKISITAKPTWTPSIYEDKIVWVDESDYDVYLYDLSTSQKRRITSDSALQICPYIYGDKIAWDDYRNGAGDADIYLYDLNTSTESRLAYDQQIRSIQSTPAIYADKVVWTDSRNELSDANWDIYMLDFSTGAERQITTNTELDSKPQIYGDNIVWLRELRGDLLAIRNAELYMYNLSTNEEKQVSTSKTFFVVSTKRPAIYEDKIVWGDAEGPPNNTYHEVYMYDIPTGQEIRVTDNRNTNYYYGTVDYLAMHDDKIVYGHDSWGWGISIIRLIYPPEITSVEPSELSYGVQVNIIGKHFGYTASYSKVLFAGGVYAPIQSWSNRKIACTVPYGAVSGPLKIVTTGGESNEVMVSVVGSPAPSDLKATPVSSTQIKLSWQDNSSDETGFRVEMSTDGVTFAYKGSAVANGTSYTVSALTAGTTYHFRVYSVRGSDKSAYSGIVQGTTLPLPQAPSNLTATPVSSTQIKLSWQDNSSDETGFRVEMSTDGVTFAYKGSAVANGTSYTVSALTAGTTYHFRVYSVRGSDKSAYSNVVNISLKLVQDKGNIL